MKSERERPSMLAARSIRDCVSIRTRRLTAWSGVSEEAVVRGISLILCAALIIEDTQRVSGFQMRDCNPIPGSGKANLGAQRRQMAKRRSTGRSEEHTSELQSLMRSSYAVFCLKKKNKHKHRARATYVLEQTQQ